MSERIYVIVLRTLDLPDRKLCMTSGRIASHAVHAVAQLQFHVKDQWELSEMDIIILSVANNAELDQLKVKLIEEGVAHLNYWDEDRIYEGKMQTAIVTFPIAKGSSKALNNLRPWKCACNETTFPRSSVAEQSVFNREAASGSAGDSGSIPAVGATINSAPPRCTKHDEQMVLTFYDRPLSPPGNGWACRSCIKEREAIQFLLGEL